MDLNISHYSYMGMNAYMLRTYSTRCCALLAQFGQSAGLMSPRSRVRAP